MLAATKKASCMPETVIDEYSLEIAGGVGDTPIHEPLGHVSRNAKLSESWHSVHGVGSAEGSHLWRGKAEIRPMANRMACQSRCSNGRATYAVEPFRLNYRQAWRLEFESKYVWGPRSSEG